MSSLYFPKELCIKSKLAISPKLRKLMPGTSRLNVYGDGDCGYHVMQLIRYFYTGLIVDVDCMKVMRYEKLRSLQCSELAEAKDHFLEYLEIGTCLGDLPLNVVLVVAIKVKRKIEYQLRVVSYNPKNVNWTFIYLSKGQRHGHYELLVKKSDAFFDIEETQEIFERFSRESSCEYPTMTISPETQISMIDRHDLRYI